MSLSSVSTKTLAREQIWTAKLVKRDLKSLAHRGKEKVASKVKKIFNKQKAAESTPVAPAAALLPLKGAAAPSTTPVTPQMESAASRPPTPPPKPQPEVRVTPTIEENTPLINDFHKHIDLKQFFAVLVKSWRSDRCHAPTNLDEKFMIRGLFTIMTIIIWRCMPDLGAKDFTKTVLTMASAENGDKIRKEVQEILIRNLRKRTAKEDSLLIDSTHSNISNSSMSSILSDALHELRQKVRKQIRRARRRKFEHMQQYTRPFAPYKLRNKDDFEMWYGPPPATLIWAALLAAFYDPDNVMARVQHPLRLIFADVDNVPEFLSYIGDYSKPRQQRIWWQDEGFEMYVDRLRHALSLEYKA